MNGTNFVGDWLTEMDPVIEQKLDQDPRFLLSLAETLYQKANQWRLVWKTIGKTDLSEKNIAELAKAFKKYVQSVYELMGYLYFPLSAEKVLTLQIERFLSARQLDASVKEKYFQLFTTPIKKSFAQQEKEALLKKITVIRSTRKKKDSLLFAHWKEWAWMGDHFFKGEFWTKDEVEKRFLELEKTNVKAELNELQSRSKRIRTQTNRAFKGLKLSATEKWLVKSAQEFVFLRSYRLDLFFISEYEIKNLLDAIGKRMGISFSELVFLTENEILDFFSGKKIDFSMIQERQKKVGLLLKNGMLTVLTGAPLESMAEKDVVQQEVFLTGMATFPGNVQGRVRIVRSLEELKTVQKGEVLVTAMTTPNFVIALEKVAAIITDEGGILCHAAIISRELQKPCIIGTKHATTVFKTGDWVLVDAKTGKVSKIPPLD